MPAWRHGDPRDVVRTILADPRYVSDVPSVVRSRTWLDMAHDWFVGLLRRLFHGIDHVLGSHDSFETAIGFALVGIGFALLGYGVYRLVRSLSRTAVLRPSGPAGAVPAGPAVTAAALHARARAAARAGRYRAAAALIFASAVRALDESGRVTFDPARTPGEYRRLVKTPAFNALTADAVVAVFAAAEPRPELVERMLQNYERCIAPTA